MRTTSKKNKFLDFLLQELEFKTDRELANLLKVGAPAISKIRNGGNVSQGMVLKIHEATDIPVNVLRDRMGLFD